MIGTVIVGRGNSREVIERPRNAQFSRALGDSICIKLGLGKIKREWPKFKGKRPQKRREQAVGG